MGNPQIDKFGTTHLNSSIASGSINLPTGMGIGALLSSTMSSAALGGVYTQMSPRIGILGQHSYKPEDRGLTDEGTNSVSCQVKRLEVAKLKLTFIEGIITLCVYRILLC